MIRPSQTAAAGRFPFCRRVLRARVFGVNVASISCAGVATRLSRRSLRSSRRFSGCRKTIKRGGGKTDRTWGPLAAEACPPDDSFLPHRSHGPDSVAGECCERVFSASMSQASCARPRRRGSAPEVSDVRVVFRRQCRTRRDRGFGGQAQPPNRAIFASFFGVNVAHLASADAATTHHRRTERYSRRFSASMSHTSRARAPRPGSAAEPSDTRDAFNLSQTILGQAAGNPTREDRSRAKRVPAG